MNLILKLFGGLIAIDTVASMAAWAIVISGIKPSFNPPMWVTHFWMFVLAVVVALFSSRFIRRRTS